MKILKILLIAMSLTTTALAHTETSETGSSLEFKGRVPVRIQWNDSDSVRFVRPRSKLVVSTWGEGKINAVLITKRKKSCSGFQKNYIGYQSAYQVYDLYLRTTSTPNPTPATTTPSAQLNIVKGHAYLVFPTGLSAATSDNPGAGVVPGTCHWSIAPDAAIEFKD